VAILLNTKRKMYRAKYKSYVSSPKISSDFCTGTGNRNNADVRTITTIDGSEPFHMPY